MTGRRRARKVPPQRKPAAVILEYAEALTELSRRWNDIILGELREQRIDAPADGDAPSFDHVAIDMAMREMERQMLRLAASPQLVQRLARVASRTIDWSGREFQRQMRAAIGVDVLSDPQAGPLVRRFRMENLELITSEARSRIAHIRKVVRAHAVNDRHESLARKIADVLPIGTEPHRARLIARDQTLKLYGSVNEERHKQAGITEYRWSTSRDERVRPDHAALEGLRFKYASPPVTDKRTGRRGNPGSDFQCRCIAVPYILGA